MRQLIGELISEGRIERGFLRISGVNIYEPPAMNFSPPVTSGSRAAQAGLQVRDIIVEVAGREVGKLSELDGVLIKYRKSSPLEVVLFRGGQKRRVTVTLEERPRYAASMAISRQVPLATTGRSCLGPDQLNRRVDEAHVGEGLGEVTQHLAGFRVQLFAEQTKV